MITLNRRMLYSTGAVGLMIELYETRTYKPDPIGMAAWQIANAGAMYAGTWWLTGEGQTIYSVYKPVIQEALYKGETSLYRSLKGPKKPPLGVFGTLAVGLDVALQLDRYLDSFNPQLNSSLM